MPLLRAKDPQALFTTEARTAQIHCVAARPPRLRGGTLSARVSNRFFTGGRAADERGSGRVTSYAIADGALCTTAAVDKPVQCLAVVETVKPAPALRPSGAASKGAQPKGAFGCELLLWAGLSDGRLAVLDAATLAPRATLVAHRGAVVAVCSPGAPPSSPQRGASIVLSGGEDLGTSCGTRARPTASAPSSAAARRSAPLPVWDPENTRTNSPERCRVWSAAADRTLSVWEPRPSARLGRAADVHTIALEGEAVSLSAAADGRLVAAAAGADGTLVFDGNGRLRARLAADGKAAAAVVVIGRGREVWVGRRRRRRLYERTAPSEWTWRFVRHLPTGSTPLAALLRGGARLGARRRPRRHADRVGVRGAAAEAADAAARRAVGADGFGAPAVAAPLLRQLRAAVDELKAARAFCATLHAQVLHGQAAIDELARRADVWRREVARHQANVAHAEGKAARSAEMREEVEEALKRARDEKRAAVAMKERAELEISRLRQAEAAAAERGAKEATLAQQLAEARAEATIAKKDRDRAMADGKRLRAALRDAQKEGDSVRPRRRRTGRGERTPRAPRRRCCARRRGRGRARGGADDRGGKRRAAAAARADEAIHLQHEREQLRAANGMQGLAQLRARFGGADAVALKELRSPAPRCRRPCRRRRRRPCRRPPRPRRRCRAADGRAGRGAGRDAASRGGGGRRLAGVRPSAATRLALRTPPPPPAAAAEAAARAARRRRRRRGARRRSARKRFAGPGGRRRRHDARRGPRARPRRRGPRRQRPAPDPAVVVRRGGVDAEDAGAGGGRRPRRPPRRGRRRPTSRRRRGSPHSPRRLRRLPPR